MPTLNYYFHEIWKIHNEILAQAKAKEKTEFHQIGENFKGALAKYYVQASVMKWQIKGVGVRWGLGYSKRLGGSPTH